MVFEPSGHNVQLEIFNFLVYTDTNKEVGERKNRMSQTLSILQKYIDCNTVIYNG